MTDEKFLVDAGWVEKRRASDGETVWIGEGISGRGLPLADAVKEQVCREAERLSFVLARCEVSLDVPISGNEGRRYTGTLTLTLKVKP